MFCKRLFVLLALAGVLSACAPRSDSVPAAPQEQEESPGPFEETISAPGPAARPTTGPTAAPRFDPRNPDWRLRAQELFEANLSGFRPPALGTSVELALANGQTKTGVLAGLSETELQLDVGVGTVTFDRLALAESERPGYFAHDYARSRAMDAVRRERASWLAKNPAVPTANPLVRPVKPQTPSRPGGVAGSPPRNEPPNNRVWQVEEYLRANLRNPASLKITEWGRVNRHGDGYSVRCTYQAATDGVGVSSEDMIFFLRSTGEVYRKAPFRGQRF